MDKNTDKLPWFPIKLTVADVREILGVRKSLKRGKEILKWHVEGLKWILKWHVEGLKWEGVLISYMALFPFILVWLSFRISFPC
jgi:hypothetical protein